MGMIGQLSRWKFSIFPSPEVGSVSSDFVNKHWEVMVDTFVRMLEMTVLLKQLNNQLRMAHLICRCKSF